MPNTVPVHRDNRKEFERISGPNVWKIVLPPINANVAPCEGDDASDILVGYEPCDELAAGVTRGAGDDDGEAAGAPWRERAVRPLTRNKRSTEHSMVFRG